jgi:hypothetical protein
VAFVERHPVAEKVTYSTDDLHRELAALYLECKMRAQREDILVAKIAELEAKLG